MNPLRLQAAGIAICACASLLGLVVEGCKLLEDDPPFQYLSACLVKGEVTGCHRVVGMQYSIRNVCDQSITRVQACFDLYDSDGVQLPNPGSNHFDLTFDGSIAPESSWTVCSSLDSSFFFQPRSELVGERFRVYRVELADGSTWCDPLGLYAYPYTLTSGDESEPQE